MTTFCYCSYILFALTLTNVYAQREADHWYFGDKAGLYFGNGVPQPLINSAMNDVQEGSSVTISNSNTGELLFYSNAEIIWNREHQIMPNGAELAGSSWGTQSSLIVPDPGEDSLYYLFTLLQEERSSNAPINLYYSKVDMRLDGGKGDIVPTLKNVMLSEDVTEKLTAIPHSSRNAYWLLTHEIDNNVFNIYLIDSTGISEVTRQAIGTVHPVRNALIGGGGYMKASPDGTMLACAIGITSGRIDETFEMFNFDARTGRLYNHLHLGYFSLPYGVSFSPDNSKLYLTAWLPGDIDHVDQRTTVLHQFDLTAPDVVSSRVGYSADRFYADGDGSSLSALQLAPDGKIYHISSNYIPNENRHQNYLHSINYPNREGNAIGIQVRQIDYGEGHGWQDLPNFMQHYFQEERIRAPGQPEGSDPCDPRFAVQLFPNPSETEINITVRERCFTPYTLRIITSTGQVLDNFAIVNETSAILSVQSLATGMYLAELRFDDRVVSKKFIVR